MSVKDIEKVMDDNIDLFRKLKTDHREAALFCTMRHDKTGEMFMTGCTTDILQIIFNVIVEIVKNDADKPQVKIMIAEGLRGVLGQITNQELEFQIKGIENEKVDSGTIN